MGATHGMKNQTPISSASGYSCIWKYLPRMELHYFGHPTSNIQQKFKDYLSYFLEAKSNKNRCLGKASPRKKPTAGPLPRPATAPTYLAFVRIEIKPTSVTRHSSSNNSLKIICLTFWRQKVTKTVVLAKLLPAKNPPLARCHDLPPLPHIWRLCELNSAPSLSSYRLF